MSPTPRPRDPGHAIGPRRIRFDLDERIPRHWFGGDVVATHIANGVNLLFPAGERFFVRSVKHYLPRIDDPELAERVRGFFGQEGSHAREHERFFRVLRAQGYDISRFLELYERVAYGMIEPLMPPALRLSGTAAAEHFTAILAEGFLKNEGVLELAHPAMRELLLWHACEEIEHKSVAFDVLQRFHPSYALRVAGLLLSAAMLSAFWILGSYTLLEQDGLGSRTLRRELRHLSEEDGLVSRVFLRGIREYLRQDFHPWQKNDLELARRALATLRTVQS